MVVSGVVTTRGSDLHTGSPHTHDEAARLLVELTVDDDEPVEPHVGHWSRWGGAWWCDTCNSPYCDLA